MVHLSVLPHLTLDLVQQALALSSPIFDARAAQARLAPRTRPLVRLPQQSGNPREAATLLLLYPHNGELHFVLTRRPDGMNDHAGQISLPGGRRHEGESFAETALRETCEEIGLCTPITLLGALTELYIPPSDYLVHPFVGYVDHRPQWEINQHEVEELIECPLYRLLDDSIKQWGETEVRGVKVDIGWYQIDQHRVWGATAIMLSEMEGRLRACLPD